MATIIPLRGHTPAFGHGCFLAPNAAIIGEVTEEMPGRVIMKTEIGAETLLPPPGGELLPRIC